MTKGTLPAGVGTGPISSGTLKPSDVIPAMLGLLDLLDKRMADELRREYDDVIRSGYGERTEMLEDAEASSWMWEAVDDAIQNALPQGYWFGTIEGDGACFGVWEEPDDDAV